MAEIDRFLDELTTNIGVEQPLDRAAFELKSAVRRMRAGVVGVHHVTCSDEAEHEDADVFYRLVAKDLSPRLKLGVNGVFRTASLGARYEWGSLGAAEGNFGTTPRGGFKLMLLKMSTHVGCIEEHTERQFGSFERYGTPTETCKALHLFADGLRAPFADELHELFTSEGIDRVAALADVDPTFRSVALAVVAARLQARSAVLEAQDHAPLVPTVYAIVPAVTINKPGRDTEIHVGTYVVDRRSGKSRDRYRGLGDDPSKYRFSIDHGHVRIEQDGAGETRDARDHRAIARQRLAEIGTRAIGTDARVNALLREAEHNTTGDGAVAKRVALSLLPLLAELTPVGAALALFGGGATGIYEAYRAHRVMRDVEDSAAARDMLHDLSARLERLPPAEARKVVEVLLRARKG